jgi:hypothetical protein
MPDLITESDCRWQETVRRLIRSYRARAALCPQRHIRPRTSGSSRVRKVALVSQLAVARIRPTGRIQPNGTDTARRHPGASR